MKKFLNYLLANSDRYLPGLSGSLPKHYVGWKGRWMAEYLRVRHPVRTLHSIWNQYRINVYFLWIKILHQIQGNFVAIFKAVTLRMSAVSRTSLLAARACRAWLSQFDLLKHVQHCGLVNLIWLLPIWYWARFWIIIIIPFVHPILHIKAIKLPAINCRSKKVLGWLAVEKVCGCSLGSILGKNIGDAVYSPRFVYG